MYLKLNVSAVVANLCLSHKWIIQEISGFIAAVAAFTDAQKQIVKKSTNLIKLKDNLAKNITDEL